MREMKFSNEIIQDWETLTYSIGEFENNFDEYNEYCNGNATSIDCIQVGSGDTPESMLLKLEYTLNQILSNCVEGFGHLWMDHFTNLQKMMTQERFSNFKDPPSNMLVAIRGRKSSNLSPKSCHQQRVDTNFF